MEPSRAGLGSRDAYGHRRYDDHLHRRHRRVLSARRGSAQRDESRAERGRYDFDALEYLHSDARAMVAMAVLRGRDRHALRHDLRGDRRQFARLRGHAAIDGGVQRRRRGGAGALSQPLHRAVDGSPRGADLHLHRSGSHGSYRRNRAGDDAAGHRPRRSLPAPPPFAERHPALSVGNRRAMGGHRVDRMADGLFGDRGDKEDAMNIERRMPRDDEFQMPSFRLDGHVALVTGGGRGLGLAMAQALADAGADVAIAARTESELETAAG